VAEIRHWHFFYSKKKLSQQLQQQQVCIFFLLADACPPSQHVLANPFAFGSTVRSGQTTLVVGGVD